MIALFSCCFQQGTFGIEKRKPSGYTLRAQIFTATSKTRRRSVVPYSCLPDLKITRTNVLCWERDHKSKNVVGKTVGFKFAVMYILGVSDNEWQPAIVTEEESA